MTYNVEHWEAVWERTTATVTVPSPIPADQHKEWLEDNWSEHAVDVSNENVSEVGLDTETTFTPKGRL